MHLPPLSSPGTVTPQSEKLLPNLVLHKAVVFMLLWHMDGGRKRDV